MSRIGKRIREERTKKGISPKQLGRKCGVSESYILDIENGSKVINDTIIKQISKVLGVDVDESILQVPKEEEQKQETVTKAKNFLNKPQEKRREVEPLAQWGEALSNIIKKVPIYDMEMIHTKDCKNFPIIDKKVEGFNPDKLVYIKLPDDTLSQYRMKKGDRCLIYLNHEFFNNTFQLVEYDGKKFLRKLKKLQGNKTQLIAGTRDDKGVIKNMKEIKILGRLIRVEIDF